jgi:hypothetical protein
MLTRHNADLGDVAVNLISIHFSPCLIFDSAPGYRSRPDAAVYLLPHQTVANFQRHKSKSKQNTSDCQTKPGHVKETEKRQIA